MIIWFEIEAWTPTHRVLYSCKRLRYTTFRLYRPLSKQHSVRTCMQRTQQRNTFFFFFFTVEPVTYNGILWNPMGKTLPDIILTVYTYPLVCLYLPLVVLCTFTHEQKAKLDISETNYGLKRTTTSGYNISATALGNTQGNDVIYLCCSRSYVWSPTVHGGKYLWDWAKVKLEVKALLEEPSNRNFCYSPRSPPVSFPCKENNLHSCMMSLNNW